MKIKSAQIVQIYVQLVRIIKTTAFHVQTKELIHQLVNVMKNFISKVLKIVIIFSVVKCVRLALRTLRIVKVAKKVEVILLLVIAIKIITLQQMESVYLVIQVIIMILFSKCVRNVLPLVLNVQDQAQTV